MSRSAPKSQKDPVAIAKRISWLIEQFYGGSVRAAARQWGITRPTLIRLLDGVIKRPRSNAFEKIAASSGATLAWLLSGEGNPPTPPPPAAMLATPALTKWESLVDGLDLGEPFAQAVSALPRTIRVAYNGLVLEGMDRADQSRINNEARARAEELEVRAWHTLFEGLIKSYGRAAFKRKLESESLLTMMQFSPVAMSLFAHPVTGPKSGADLNVWKEAMGVAAQGWRYPPAEGPSREPPLGDSSHGPRKRENLKGRMRK
ncbi:MAG: hypothetical protein M3Z54_14660 [Gemmatimonadota bacterium]|nr:hypothetical protein [Gemmatimonadota bacterium]